MVYFLLSGLFAFMAKILMLQFGLNVVYQRAQPLNENNSDDHVLRNRPDALPTTVMVSNYPEKDPEGVNVLVTVFVLKV